MANEFASELPDEAVLGDVPVLDDSFWTSILDGAYNAPEGAADDLVDTYDPDADVDAYDDVAEVDTADGIDHSALDDAAATDTATAMDASDTAVDDATESETDAATTTTEPASSDGEFEGINDPFAIIDQIMEPVTDVEGTGSTVGDDAFGAADSGFSSDDHSTFDGESGMNSTDLDGPFGDRYDATEGVVAHDSAADADNLNDSTLDDSTLDESAIDDTAFDDSSNFGNF